MSLYEESTPSTQKRFPLPKNTLMSINVAEGMDSVTLNLSDGLGGMISVDVDSKASRRAINAFRAPPLILLDSNKHYTFLDVVAKLRAIDHSHISILVGPLEFSVCIEDESISGDAVYFGESSVGADFSISTKADQMPIFTESHLIVTDPDTPNMVVRTHVTFRLPNGNSFILVY